MKEPNDITLPISAEETIKLLDETFPEKCADLSMEINEIWFKSGQIHVQILDPITNIEDYDIDELTNLIYLKVSENLTS